MTGPDELVPVGPVQTVLGVGVDADDPSRVFLAVSTPIGSAVYFLSARQAVEVAAALASVGRAAAAGLHLPDAAR